MFDNLYETQKFVSKWAVIVIMLLAIGAILFFSMSGTDFSFGTILSQQDMHDMFGALSGL